MVLQANGSRCIHFEKGTAQNPMIPFGSSLNTAPSFISMRRGAPQSRHGASIRTTLPGLSQQTASDSNPHWPNHFCTPSTLIRYCVGRLLKGAKLLM